MDIIDFLKKYKKEHIENDPINRNIKHFITVKLPFLVDNIETKIKDIPDGFKCYENEGKEKVNAIMFAPISFTFVENERFIDEQIKNKDLRDMLVLHRKEMWMNAFKIELDEILKHKRVKFPVYAFKENKEIKVGKKYWNIVPCDLKEYEKMLGMLDKDENFKKMMKDGHK